MQTQNNVTKCPGRRSLQNMCKLHGYAPHKEYAQTKASSGRKLAPQVTEGECGTNNQHLFYPLVHKTTGSALNITIDNRLFRSLLPSFASQNPPPSRREAMVGANNTVTHGMNGLPTVPPLCKGRWLPKADGGIVLDGQHPLTPRATHKAGRETISAI